MHKSKPTKHKPVMTKPRNKVVAALLQSPKRNAGKHKGKEVQPPPLTMLDPTEKD